MKFETAYGRWLVQELNSRTTQKLGIACKRYKEVSYKPLYRNSDQIAVIIGGGGAARSGVQGQDQNDLSLTVTLICKSTYTDDVREAIDEMQEAFNAVPQKLMYNDLKDGVLTTIEKPVKSVFLTPVVLDESDYPTITETIKATFLMFTVSVTYGTTAIVEPPKYSLWIGETEYEIKYLSDFDSASQPVYDAYLAQGEDRPRQCLISRANSWVFTIQKVSTENCLQTVFENELHSLPDGLYGKALKLKKGENESRIEIRTYQLAESYVDNAAAYVLTLTS